MKQDAQADLKHAGEAALFRLGGDDADYPSGYRKLVHGPAYLSRQLKQGSMLAMMSPASATELPRSMKGTVGVFL